MELIPPSYITVSEFIRLICFDFGLKRIGTATGNTLTRTAQSLHTLAAKNGQPDWSDIDQLIAQWKPHRIVVGLPLAMDGAEGPSAKRARTFGERIEKHTRLEVVFVDERLSSASANTLMRESPPGLHSSPKRPGSMSTKKSMSKKRIRARDSLAAELILQTYFEDYLV